MDVVGGVDMGVTWASHALNIRAAACGHWLAEPAGGRDALWPTGSNTLWPLG